MPFKFNPFTGKPDIVDVTTIPPGTVSGLVGDTGGSVGPDGSGDINIVGGSDISVTGDSGTNTLTVDYTGNPIDFLAGDSGGNIGPDGSGVVGILGGTDISVTGSGTDLTIAYTGTAPIEPTQFVVGPTGNYATWALAIAAASSGDVIYIQPGTYTESINFDLAAGVSFVALHDTNLGNGVILNGLQNPPLSGNMTFQGIYFQNSSAVTATFRTTSAGSPNIQFINCAFDNSTAPEFMSTSTFSGNIYMIGCKSVGNVQALVSMQAGSWYVRDCDFQHTVGSNICNGTSLTVLNSRFTGALTGSANMSLQNSYLGVVYNGGSSTGSIYNCYLSSPSLAAFAQSSTGTWSLINCIIDTPANPSIDGSGSGTLIISDLTFLSNASIGASLTVTYEDTRIGKLTIGNNTTTAYPLNLPYNSGSPSLGVNRADGVSSGSIFFIASPNDMYMDNNSGGGSIAIRNNNPSGTNGFKLITRVSSVDTTYFYSNPSNSVITSDRARLICSGSNTSLGTNGEIAVVILKSSLSRDTGILFKDESDVLYWQIGRSYIGGGPNTRLEFLYQNNRYAYFNSSGQFRLISSTFVDSSAAILEISSTTSGVRFPNMTTTQKNSISNLAGNVVFDTTLGKLCVNTGSAWQTITST